MVDASATAGISPAHGLPRAGAAQEAIEVNTTMWDSLSRSSMLI